MLFINEMCILHTLYHIETWIIVGYKSNPLILTIQFHIHIWADRKDTICILELSSTFFRYLGYGS